MARGLLGIISDPWPNEFLCPFFLFFFFFSPIWRQTSRNGKRGWISITLIKSSFTSRTCNRDGYLGNGGCFERGSSPIRDIQPWTSILLLFPTADSYWAPTAWTALHARETSEEFLETLQICVEREISKGWQSLMRQKVKRIKFNDTTFKRAKLHLESQLRYLFVLSKSIDPCFLFF